MSGDTNDRHAAERDAAAARLREWAAQQETAFHGLIGRSVDEWRGIEMAFRERGASGGVEFADPACSFLQLGVLYASIEGRVYRVITYMSDHSNGLEVDDFLDALPSEVHEPESIYRTRRLTELPVGRIGAVSLRFDEFGINVAVTLEVGDRRLLLEAGEVYEEWDGGLQVVKPDESILASVVELR